MTPDSLQGREHRFRFGVVLVDRQGPLEESASLGAVTDHQVSLGRQYHCFWPVTTRATRQERQRQVGAVGLEIGAREMQYRLSVRAELLIGSLSNETNPSKGR